ncbi:hypothetical protein LIER_14850 [Lithospermum erythrorhizon]|uniref:RNase H type-1 domain-containing protein n=1 Tax=Lithospermum erythrorhizon TaxID=34254 RepID=A0AAV3Q308_LITER
MGVELNEFDITYRPRTSVKALALSGFFIECTTRQPVQVSRATEPSKPAKLPEWVVYVDGARNSKGSGSGILIGGPNQITMEYALKFLFEATNNEAEYEVMIAEA